MAGAAVNGDALHGVNRAAADEAIARKGRAVARREADLYRLFGLNPRQHELIACAAPTRSYYWRQPPGRRLFDLRLSGATLALCGASSPDDQTLIDAVLRRAPAERFAREFLKAKGVRHVDDMFDALAAPLLSAE